MLQVKFHFIWSSGFKGEDFYRFNQSEQELTVVAMLFDQLGCYLLTTEHIDASGLVFFIVQKSVREED